MSLIAYLANIIHQSLNSKYSFFGLNILVFINLILLCSHIAENLGPKIKPNDNLYVCHSNVHSTPSHKLRIAVLESFVAMHNSDIICKSETFLNTYKDNDLNLNGYSLLQEDHPSNAKREEFVFITSTF